jgi:hypothetical protein
MLGECVGEKVELRYIIMNTVGLHLLYEFVNKERSSENLKFYVACEHFEEMCKLSRKKKSGKQSSLSVSRYHSSRQNRHGSQHASSRHSHQSTHVQGHSRGHVSSQVVPGPGCVGGSVDSNASRGTLNGDATDHLSVDTVSVQRKEPNNRKLDARANHDASKIAAPNITAAIQKKQIQPSPGKIVLGPIQHHPSNRSMHVNDSLLTSHSNPEGSGKSKPISASTDSRSEETDKVKHIIGESPAHDSTLGSSVIYPAVNGVPHSPTAAIRKTEHWKSTSIKYFTQQSAKFSTASTDENSIDIVHTARNKAHSITSGQQTPLESLFASNFRGNNSTALPFTPNGILSTPLPQNVRVKPVGPNAHNLISLADGNTLTLTTLSTLPSMAEEQGNSELSLRYTNTQSDFGTESYPFVLNRIMSCGSENSNTRSNITLISANSHANSNVVDTSPCTGINYSFNGVTGMDTQTTHADTFSSKEQTPLSFGNARSGGVALTTHMPSQFVSTDALSFSPLNMHGGQYASQTPSTADTLATSNTQINFRLSSVPTVLFKQETEYLMDSVRTTDLPLTQEAVDYTSNKRNNNYIAEIDEVEPAAHVSGEIASVAYGSLKHPDDMTEDSEAGYVVDVCDAQAQLRSSTPSLLKSNRQQHIPCSHSERMSALQAHMGRINSNSAGVYQQLSSQPRTSGASPTPVTTAGTSADSRVEMETVPGRTQPHLHAASNSGYPDHVCDPTIQVINSNLKGVRDYLQSIVDKHIKEGSPDEVNISHAQRVSLVGAFEAWSAQCMPLIASASSFNIGSSDEDIHAFVQEESKLITQGSSLLVSAKSEIYDLLKKDSYSRFTKTAEFKAFIAGLRPFESYEQIGVGKVTKEEYNTIRSQHQTTQ